MTHDATPSERDARHQPVLLDEVMHHLAPQPGEVCLDATVGRAGHAAALVPRLAPGGRYVGLDLDPGNVEYVRDRLADAPVRVDVQHADFAQARGVLDELAVDRVDLVLADLGFASSQMDAPQRGMSFATDGPLDMRLDPTAGTTAGDLVNATGEKNLADLIYQYGEERLSRRIARKIVERRRHEPIMTTRQLADLCVAAYGPRARRQRIHPATRTFMALRIAVNDELARLQALLDSLPDLLRSGGRAVVISFHSLEDRAVKHAFRRLAAAGQAEALTAKPARPGETERLANPRSRSAKLRALRWLGHAGHPDAREHGAPA